MYMPIAVFETYINLYYAAKSKRFSDDTIAELQGYIVALEEQSEVFTRFSKSSKNFPKWHLIGHFAKWITENGKKKKEEACEKIEKILFVT